MARVRDIELLDRLQSIEPVVFDGPVWRVVRQGRDPLTASSAGGRWDDGSFSVLYTAAVRQGAIAEAYFYLMNGQPVAPSKITYELFELHLRLGRSLQLVDLGALNALGVDTAHYGKTHYAQRQIEYPRTQEVGETAHFLGFDGLQVPNARYDCQNIILFDDVVDGASKKLLTDHGTVEFESP
ncbi:MAG: RES family NAD+ phosphorylase [Pseudomonadota bacterium]